MTMTEPDLPFPKPPALTPDPELLANREGDATAERLAQTAAERDRLAAEVKRLREEREATGFYRVVGFIAQGIGAAVALTLTFGVLVAIVAGIAYLVGWRP